MKKLTALFLAFSMVAFGLTGLSGCGAKDTKAAGSGKTEASGKTTSDTGSKEVKSTEEKK